jgi:hypothetical protein
VEHLVVLKAVVESYIVLGRTLEPNNPVGFYKVSSRTKKLHTELPWSC